MKPTIALFAGDPAGIGPEILAKVLADDEVRRTARVIIIGSRPVIERGMAVAQAKTPLVEANGNGGDFDGTMFARWSREDEDGFELGVATAKAGAFMLEGLAFGLHLCTSGLADAMCFAPLNKSALKAGGMQHSDEMAYFRQVLDFEGETIEFNVSDELWTSRVTSHVPLKEVSSLITEEKIIKGIRLLREGLQAAGLQEPRIAVCGLNPHNGENGAFGREEIDVIEPAVQKAHNQGLPATGPLPADTAFVRATAKEGGFDGVLTMYHDQGQIAMKLMSFGRGVTVHYGLPMPVTTPSHGTAYDMVGRGIATPLAMKNAIMTAARMATSRMAGRVAAR